MDFTSPSTIEVHSYSRQAHDVLEEGREDWRTKAGHRIPSRTRVVSITRAAALSATVVARGNGNKGFAVAIEEAVECRGEEAKGRLASIETGVVEEGCYP